MDIVTAFEDDYLLVVDKPSGLVVNRAETVKEETLQDWVEKKYPIFQNLNYSEKEKDFYLRSGLVHRLDKETSGLLIIAKNFQVFSALQAQFKAREIVKKYLTLVHGKLVPVEGVIKASVGRLPWNRHRFGVIPAGKPSCTFYRVLAYYQDQEEKKTYSFLEVSPLTGRTHQIRVHLKYLDKSIVGDSLYAGRKVSQTDRLFCPRLFLHASYLKLEHPITQRQMEFQSPLPDELKQVLKKMILFEK